LSDHLGSAWETLDASGNSLALFSYDPWGRRTQVSGTDHVDIGFTGDHFHYQSGLDLTWFRGYNPNLGRWLNRDPIEEYGGLNLYGYVENNPVDFVDQNGKMGVIPEEAAAAARIAAKPALALALEKLVEAAYQALLKAQDDKIDAAKNHPKNGGSCPSPSTTPAPTPNPPTPWGDNELGQGTN
jgi:RHS repeat-associated protein